MHSLFNIYTINTISRPTVLKKIVSRSTLNRISLFPAPNLIYHPELRTVLSWGIYIIFYIIYRAFGSIVTQLPSLLITLV